MKKTTHLLTPFVIIALFGMPSQAAPIASDSFATTAGGNDYDVGSIYDQNPTVGSSGFTDAWNEGGTGATSAFVARHGGLTHNLTPGETLGGQLIAATWDGSDTRILSRAIDYTPSDGTYYMSVLLHKNAATTRGDLLAGLGRFHTYSVDGTWIGFVGGGIQFFRGPGANFTLLLTAAEMNVGEGGCPVGN